MPPGAAPRRGHLLPRGEARGNAADVAAHALLPHGPVAGGAGHRLELAHAGRRASGRSRSARSTPGRCCPSRTPRRARPTTAASSPTSPRPRTCSSRPGPRVRGDQLLRRHLVRDPPRRRRGSAAVAEVAADGGAGTVAQRVRDRLIAQALDMGAPGRRHASSAPAGCGSTWPRRCWARPRPRPTRSCAARSRSRSRSPTRDARARAAHGRRRPARRDARPGRHPHASLADGGPRAGTAPPRRSPRPTRAATSRPTASRCASTTRRRASGCARPQRARAGAKVRISASVLDSGSGLAGRPRITFGDGTRANGFHLAHLYKRTGRYTVTIRATDRAGNTALVRRDAARTCGSGQSRRLDRG